MMLRARLRNFARDTRNTWDYYGSKRGGFSFFRAGGVWGFFFWFFFGGGGGGELEALFFFLVRRCWYPGCRCLAWHRRASGLAQSVSRDRN